MRASRAAVWLLLALALPAAGVAVNARDVEPVGSPDAGYLEAVRGRGLQAEIVYLRPAAALPKANVAAPNVPGVPDPEAARRDWAIFLGVLLALVILLAVLYGRGVAVPFRSAARDPQRRSAAERLQVETSPRLAPEAFLEALHGMPDRRRALILLVTRALERAAEANGLRLGRAQTARDALRTMPRRWRHFEALRHLVAEAEIVRFGGRDLPEERWRACLECARPLFGAEHPA